MQSRRYRRSGPFAVIPANIARNVAAGRALTILSRTRTCAPTARMKYNVSIAVVSFAKAQGALGATGLILEIRQFRRHHHRERSPGETAPEPAAMS
jgi:hypothetical protein